MTNHMRGKVFTTQEVQAIIAGDKTQFREVIKNISPRIVIRKGKNNQHFAVGDNWAKCPYQVGQKIFVKESFCISSYLYLRSIIYRADSENDDQDKWKPAQHMKQEHSRLTLSIKNIGVERIGDISEEDAIAEGVVIPKTVLYDKLTALRLFRNFWNKKHPKHSFESNPFVWKINFEVVK